MNEQDDQVGDFAYDILRDKHLLLGIATLPAARRYLGTYLASNAVLADLEEAWRKFEMATKGASQRPADIGWSTAARTSRGADSCGPHRCEGWRAPA